MSEEISPWKETRIVGKPVPRVDGFERLSGQAVYPIDISLPNMLYGAILRCPYPSARVKRVDTSAAEKMPGVRDVITGKTKDADINFPYEKGVHSKLFDALCRHEGEEVAAVAADTIYQARDALAAIKVEYEILPFVVDDRKALEPNAPRVQPSGNRIGEPQTYRRGDLAKGFAEADLVLEASYRTETEIHATMETHGCVAKWKGKRLTVWESAQGVFRVRADLASILGLPMTDVRVIGKYVGGGFGAKTQAGKYTVIAAVLARRTGRPVKIFLSREETYLCVGNKPACQMKLKAGVKKDGSLTALDFACTGAAGAYPSLSGGSVLTDWVVKDLYTCPNVQTQLTDVYIHAGPSRYYRAPGHPSGAWALEQMLDALAEGIGMNPVDLRLKNIPSFSQATDGNPPYTTTGLKQCLEDGAKAFGWESARKAAKETKGPLRRGVGMAAGMWINGAGFPPATVLLKLLPDGSVTLNMGASDIGTGTKTIMSMVVAEELGIPLDKIEIEHADTGTTHFTFPSAGSKTVPTEAPAVRSAALHVKQQLLAIAAQDLKVNAADLYMADGDIRFKNDPGRKVKTGELPTLKRRGEILGVGIRGPNIAGKRINPFCAQFCEVEVNMKTGEVRVLRFLSANDSGRVMNRMTYDNQVIGGVNWGAGFALTEARIMDETQTGKVLNKNHRDYKLVTAMDVPPEVVSLPIELDDPEANLAGAKGLGEPVTVPTGAAIANAVYHATGLRFTTAPITPMDLLGRIAARKEG
ncbi:MAG TPA: xanthine dehydrogenase family protein molybdopterin-binding subunit, partial [Thermodesulfobacteriota bacterium]|nr:xanthine dehydrogenase family protein molybdopterin-binding subunit [Thermodesulfobacteriota bacterium]